VDSQIVNELIRRICWPLLRKQGFTDFSGRTARRMTADRIEVINFQSFNSYLANAIGCTSFSFSVNLGVFLTRIPHRPADEAEKTTVSFRPAEFDCHLRRRLLKTLSIDSYERGDTWSISADGANAERLVLDATDKIKAEALPWFERYRNSETLLETLHTEEPLSDGTWGCGTMTSPSRRLITGYVHLMRGEPQLATGPLSSVVDFEYFSSISSEIARDLEDARRQSAMINDLERN
jgi:uncharacterized protein DUF4304